MRGDDLSRHIDELTEGETWETKHRLQVHRECKDGDHQDVDVVLQTLASVRTCTRDAAEEGSRALVPYLGDTTPRTTSDVARQVGKGSLAEQLARISNSFLGAVSVDSRYWLSPA